MLDIALGIAICILIVQSVRAAGWKKIAKMAQKSNCEFRETIQAQAARMNQYENAQRIWATALKKWDITLMIDNEKIEPYEQEKSEDWPEILQ